MSSSFGNACCRGVHPVELFPLPVLDPVVSEGTMVIPAKPLLNGYPPEELPPWWSALELFSAIFSAAVQLLSPIGWWLWLRHFRRRFRLTMNRMIPAKMSMTAVNTPMMIGISAISSEEEDEEVVAVVESLWISSC